MPNFGDTERYIKTLFADAGKFTYEGQEYTVVKCGKPAPARGECKTDVYVLGRTRCGNEKEFKVSVKQANANFLENKISLERAKEILGNDAQKIIEKSIAPIKKSFTEDYLVYFAPYRRTEAKCIKLGWKFEFLNCPSGNMGAEMKLTDSQKIDVYTGSNLNAEKRNCLVNGERIPDSGVANFIIEADKDDQPLDYYLNRMLPIEEFAKKQTIYFACKALNYRSSKDKWDGDRPLAIYVNWTIKNGKLHGEVIFSAPLSKRGNEVGENVRLLLRQLSISSRNFNQLTNHLHADVKSHR